MGKIIFQWTAKFQSQIHGGLLILIIFLPSSEKKTEYL